MQSDRRRAQQRDPDSADPALHTHTAMIGAGDFGLAGRIDSTHGFAAARARALADVRAFAHCDIQRRGVAVTAVHCRSPGWSSMDGLAWVYSLSRICARRVAISGSASRLMDPRRSWIASVTWVAST